MQPIRRIHRNKLLLNNYKLLLRSLIKSVFYIQYTSIRIFLNLLLNSLRFCTRLSPISRSLLLTQSTHRAPNGMISVVKQPHESIWIGKSYNPQAVLRTVPDTTRISFMRGFWNDTYSEPLTTL